MQSRLQKYKVDIQKFGRYSLYNIVFSAKCLELNDKAL